MHIYYIETIAGNTRTITQFTNYHDVLSAYISLVYRPERELESVELQTPQFTISTTIRWADDD